MARKNKKQETVTCRTCKAQIAKEDAFPDNRGKYRCEDCLPTAVMVNSLSLQFKTRTKAEKFIDKLESFCRRHDKDFLFSYEFEEAE